MSQATTWGVPRNAAEADLTREQYAERSDEAFDAILSCHSGSTAPPYAVKGAPWLDTSASPNLLKIYDGMVWRTLGRITGLSSIGLALSDAATTAAARSAIGAASIGANSFTADQSVLSTFLSCLTPAAVDGGGHIIAGRSSWYTGATAYAGVLLFQGPNTSLVQINYAWLRGRVINATAGAEAGELQFITYAAGGVGERGYVGLGLYMIGATDQGAGTINGVLYDGGRRAMSIGIGQSWANVTFSRSAGTVYQNATGRPIMAAITDPGGAVQVGNTNPPGHTIASSGSGSVTFIVPPAHFYRVNTNYSTWYEMG